MESYSILLLICFALDIFFTYFNVFTYIKLYPKKDYHRLELNQIVGFFWRKFGVILGGIIASILSFLIILAFIFFGTIELRLIMIGMYFMIIFYHINNYTELKKESNKKKGIKEVNHKKLRILLFGILIGLSIFDLSTTYIYLNNYHNWQPERQFNQMESNPLLLFLFNLFDLELGLLLGTIIIWSLMYIIAFKIKGYFGLVTIFLLTMALTLGIINNLIHINMLNKLIGG